MKRLESSFKNMVLVLTIISVAAAALLAFVNSSTASTIDQLKHEKEESAVWEVLGVNPSEANYEINKTVNYLDERKTDSVVISKVSLNNDYIGTAVQLSDNSGFGGKLSVIAGFSEDGTIKGYKVLEHSETPGLGARANEWFRTASAGDTQKVGAFAKVFFGKPDPAANHNIIGMSPAESNLTVSKDGGDVDAITASTITSRAFLRAVQNAYNAYKGNDAVTTASPKAEPKDECGEAADCGHACAGCPKH